MFSGFPQYLVQFFPQHLSRQLRELYTAFTIGNLAVSLVMIFEPIFLYRLGFSIPNILSFYLAVYVLYFVLMPLGAKASLKYGYEKCIFIGSLFLVLYYLSLFGVQSSVVFAPVAAAALALQKVFFWPSFHYGFARYGEDAEEGREISGREVLDLILQSIGPFLGGLILYLSNFSTLFLVASILIVLSNVPLLVTREAFTPESFSYRDCYRRLINPEKRRVVVSFLGYGEELILLVLWPLFIYIVFVGDLLSLGSLIALTTFATIVVILYVGRLTDRTNKEAVLRISTVLYAAVWGLRLFISTVASVFAVDALSRLTKRMIAVPQMAILYERARHRQHAMATAVLFEMSLVIGKIIALVATIIIFSVAPSEFVWPATFTLASLFTLLYLFL